MNQEKIGKYICERRKEKNLTQEQLGSKIGVGAKTVSKWERGINMPDFSNLAALAKILDVTVNDILETGNISNGDEIILDTIKYYSNNYKKKYIKISVFLMVLLVSLFLFLFFVNNFNKDKLYMISTDDSKFSVKGYYFYNPNNNVFIINGITFQSELAGTIEEPCVKELRIFLNNNESGSLGYSKNNFNEPLPLGEALENISFDFYEEKYKNTYVFSNKEVENFKLIIEIVDEDGIIKTYEINLEISEIYSNNKLFY